MSNCSFGVVCILCGVLMASMPLPSDGADYIVRGILNTSVGAKAGCNKPVKHVKVDMYDDDIGPDDYLGTDFTAANGFFVVVFDMYIENPDVYIDVHYKFQAPDSRFVYVRDMGTTKTIVDEKPGNAAQTDGIWEDIPPGNNNLGTINLPSNKANIGSQTTDCLRWVKSHSTGWNVPQDLIAYARFNEPQVLVPVTLLGYRNRIMTTQVWETTPFPTYTMKPATGSPIRPMATHPRRDQESFHIAMIWRQTKETPFAKVGPNT